LANIAQDRLLDIVDQTGLPGRTAATITELEPLLRELTLVRTRQYAVDDEEDNEGVLCVGAPVYDHRGTCVAAISLTGLKSTLPAGGVAQLGEVVHRYATEISINLGADSQQISS
jgi:IclR family acetate operon transcriptional repressor